MSRSLQVDMVDLGIPMACGDCYAYALEVPGTQLVCSPIVVVPNGINSYMNAGEIVQTIETFAPPFLWWDRQISH